MGHLEIDPKNLPCPQPSQNCDRNWLLSRLEMVLSGYRKADYHDPKAFALQVAMNLEKYPAEVIEYVTSPTTGIQTRSQWPPTLAEIVKACQAEQDHLNLLAKYSNSPRSERLPAPKFSVAESYETMVEKYGRPFGPFEKGRQLPYGSK